MKDLIKKLKDTDELMGAIYGTTDEAMPIKDALIEAELSLKETGVHFILGGALAGATYHYRATNDIDFFVASSQKDVANKAMVAAGFSLTDQSEFSKELKAKRIIYKYIKKHREVDIIVLDNQALFNKWLTNAKVSSGYKILSANDLVISKLLSNRMKDKADVLAYNRAVKLDHEYIKVELSELNLLNRFPDWDVE